LVQDPPSPIDEVGEERQIHHLRTNIFTSEEQPRALPSSIAIDNNERKQPTKKLISRKNEENTCFFFSKKNTTRILFQDFWK
jgi:hypothetical protein